MSDIGKTLLYVFLVNYSHFFLINKLVDRSLTYIILPFFDLFFPLLIKMIFECSLSNNNFLFSIKDIRPQTCRHYQKNLLNASISYIFAQVRNIYLVL